MKNLNKLYWIKKEIQQIESQIKELTILSAVAIDGVSGSNKVTSPVERFYNRLEKLKEKLNTKHTESLEEQNQLEEYIETIEDEEIRVLARGRFIECKSYEQLGYENHMDRTTVSKKLRHYIERNDNNEKDL